MELRLIELSYVKEEYPQFSKRIDELYYRDTQFQSLCADYALCKKSLLSFQRQQLENQKTIKDYENVFEDLEKELLQYLRE